MGCQAAIEAERWLAKEEGSLRRLSFFFLFRISRAFSSWSRSSWVRLAKPSRAILSRMASTETRLPPLLARGAGRSGEGSTRNFGRRRKGVELARPVA